MNYISQDPEIIVSAESDGNYKVDLMRDGNSISRCRIANRPIAIGRAVVDMGGIADVGTDETLRYQGLSRRVLLEAIRFMEHAQFGLTMLYGIPNYYYKYGYAAAGPDCHALIKTYEQQPELPTGWQMRALRESDMADVKRLYNLYLAENVCGTRARPDDSTSWRELGRVASGERPDDCFVLLAPDGHICAYAWHGRGSWVTDGQERSKPSTLVISEAIAECPESADVLLMACDIWMRDVAVKEERDITSIKYAVTDEGPVAAALMRKDSTFTQMYSACANCMVRVSNMPKLFEQMLPEWRRLARQGAVDVDTVISFTTEAGTMSLNVDMGGVSISEQHNTGCSVELSVADMGQLVLGALPVDDILARLPKPPSAAAAAVCNILFPRRHQHMFLADRY